MEQLLDGVGIHIHEDRQHADLVFEIQEFAIDNETGEAASAGLLIGLLLKEGCELRDISYYESVAAKIAAEGWEAAGITPDKMKPITWAEYIEKKYDEIVRL